MSDKEVQEIQLKERFEKLAQLHPDVVAQFTVYYKYRFVFTVEIDGVGWYFTIGQDSSDIYRCEIQPEMPLSKVLQQATLQDAWEAKND